MGSATMKLTTLQIHGMNMNVKYLFRDVFLLDDKEMVEFLDMTHGFIAGSAALWAYLSRDMDYTDPKTSLLGWMPNDIDIWIPVPTARVKLVQSFVEGFMASNAYAKVDCNMDKYKGIKCMANHILQVATFERTSTSSKLQFILVTEEATIEKVLTTFDLSACACAWTPDNRFHALDGAENDADAMQMTLKSDTPCNRKRIQKYHSRGFTVHTGNRDQ